MKGAALIQRLTFRGFSLQAFAVLVVRFTRYLLRQFVRDQGALSAAALTYTTLFAVVPLMTVTYAMLASIPSFQGVGGQLEALIFDHFVPSSGVAMRDYLSQFASQARALTAIGVGFLVVTAYLMLKSIESAFNKIWRVSEPRRGLSSFLLYWAVLSLGPMLLGLGFVLSSYVASLPLISGATEVAGVLELVPLLLSAAAFTLIYAAVPNCPVPLGHAAVGGIVIALLFEAAKSAFTLFVTQFPSYKLIYGAFAAFPLFLAWIYISWLIVLLGAELVRGLSVFSRAAATRDPAPLLVLLEVLFQLWQAQKQGACLDDRQLLRQVRGLDQERWDQFLLHLRGLSLVERTVRGGYVLSRDLRQIRLWELYRELPWQLPESAEVTEVGAWQAALQARLRQVEDQGREALAIELGELFTEGGCPQESAQQVASPPNSGSQDPELQIPSVTPQSSKQ